MTKSEVKYVITESQWERIEKLQNQTMKDARRYCEPRDIKSWVDGYMTAVEDIIELIKEKTS